MTTIKQNKNTLKIWSTQVIPDLKVHRTIPRISGGTTPNEATLQGSWAPDVIMFVSCCSKSLSAPPSSVISPLQDRLFHLFNGDFNGDFLDWRIFKTKFSVSGDWHLKKWRRVPSAIHSTNSSHLLLGQSSSWSFGKAPAAMPSLLLCHPLCCALHIIVAALVKVCALLLSLSLSLSLYIYWICIKNKTPHCLPFSNRNRLDEILELASLRQGGNEHPQIHKSTSPNYSCVKKGERKWIDS